VPKVARVALWGLCVVSVCAPSLQASKRPLVVDSLPGVELLSARERELCSVWRLYPKQYLLIKSKLLELALMSDGTVKKLTARNYIALDPIRVNAVFEFMEQSGAIRIHFIYLF
jgi:hypothetical protein